jgi:hypothetical protein
MSRPLAGCESLTHEQRVMLSIDSLLGKTFARSAKARKIWPRAVKSFVESQSRGHFPDALVEARQRLGTAQGDEPRIRVVLEMGRVKRDGSPGDTLSIKPMNFWAKVDRSAGPDACWPFMGYRDADGYGRQKAFTSMRIVWALVHGPIPPHMVICHQCDNPPCCNPDHLFIGTIQDNMTDAELKRHKRNRVKNSAALKTE